MAAIVGVGLVAAELAAQLGPRGLDLRALPLALESAQLRGVRRLGGPAHPRHMGGDLNHVDQAVGASARFSSWLRCCWALMTITPVAADALIGLLQQALLPSSGNVEACTSYRR